MLTVKFADFGSMILRYPTPPPRGSEVGFASAPYKLLTFSVHTPSPRQVESEGHRESYNNQFFFTVILVYLLSPARKICARRGSSSIFRITGSYTQRHGASAGPTKPTCKRTVGPPLAASLLRRTRTGDAPARMWHKSSILTPPGRVPDDSLL